MYLTSFGLMPSTYTSRLEGSGKMRERKKDSEDNEFVVVSKVGETSFVREEAWELHRRQNQSRTKRVRC
jgi:hypothetical protein